MRSITRERISRWLPRASVVALLLDALQKWASDDLRSLNAQIEFVLRDSLAKTGRLGAKKKA